MKTGMKSADGLRGDGETGRQLFDEGATQALVVCVVLRDLRHRVGARVSVPRRTRPRSRWQVLKKTVVRTLPGAHVLDQVADRTFSLLATSVLLKHLMFVYQSIYVRV